MCLARCIKVDEQLSNRVGFVLPRDAPIVVFLQDVPIYERVAHALARVGYEDVVGYLEGGIEGRFKKVYDVHGGIEEWQMSGFEFSRNGR
jgi:rhodanese-related sulfurtransferase